jgi:anti-anti-sigma factor
MTQADALDIEVVHDHRGYVVSLIGTASMDLCERLDETLGDVCRKKPARLVVDVHRLSFICSLGLGGWVVAYLRMQKHGGTFTIAAPPKPIRDMLNTTKLGTMLPVCDSVEEALSTTA